MPKLEEKKSEQKRENGQKEKIGTLFPTQLVHQELLWVSFSNLFKLFSACFDI
jgi:hypothetical protein